MSRALCGCSKYGADIIIKKALVVGAEEVKLKSASTTPFVGCCPASWQETYLYLHTNCTQVKVSFCFDDFAEHSETNHVTNTGPWNDSISEGGVGWRRRGRPPSESRSAGPAARRHSVKKTAKGLGSLPVGRGFLEHGGQWIGIREVKRWAESRSSRWRPFFDLGLDAVPQTKTALSPNE